MHLAKNKGGAACSAAWLAVGSNSDHWPMTLSVYNFFGQYQANWALVSADVVLTILPVILVYIVAQRWILSGMSAGAVKG